MEFVPEIRRAAVKAADDALGSLAIASARAVAEIAPVDQGNDSYGKLRCGEARNCREPAFGTYVVHDGFRAVLGNLDISSGRLLDQLHDACLGGT